MGTHGQSNFLGINYQAWSALALFLQYLRDPEFVSIHLESPKLQDFDLLFSDGRKIICEAKAWSRNSFGEASLKKLLDDIGGRGEALKDNDSILIVTKKASKSLKRFLRSARYISSEYSYELVEKSAFEFEQLPILAKVEIWETDQENCIQIALSLMAELLGVWVSSESLLKIVQSFLIEKIYHGSATGKVIKRQELLAMIDYEREAVRLAVGADQTPTAERLTLIRNATSNPEHPLWSPSNLSALTGNIGEVIFAFDELAKKKISNLRAWEHVLEAMVQLRSSHRVFELISNNLDSKENRTIAMDFLDRQSGKSRAFFSFDFSEVEVMRLGLKVAEADNSMCLRVVNMLSALFENFQEDSFFLDKRDHVRYLKEKLGEVLNRLYVIGSEDVEACVVNLILQKFCLVEDDGEYWDDTSPQIYQLLCDYVCAQLDLFEKRFLVVVGKLVEQFEEIYREKFRLRFKGYELAGGISTWWGDAYSVKDRFFVRMLLRPALLKFYADEPVRACKLIKENCVVSDSRVSKSNPDFLRRAAIPVLLKEFQDNRTENRRETKKLLARLIKSKRGIPSKHELVFQDIHRVQDPSLRWRLLAIAVELTEGPMNSFVANSVGELACSGHHLALQTLKHWLRRKEGWSDSILGGGPLKLLGHLFRANDEDAFDTLLFFIEGEYFERKIRDINVYDWSDFLVNFVATRQKGVFEVLRKLVSLKSLTESQQVLFVASVSKMAKSDETQEALKIEVCKELVQPVLADGTYVTKFPVSHIREQFVECAEGLVKDCDSDEAIECAVSILEVLCKDPSPEAAAQNDSSSDSDSEMFTIETVRGKCAWALQHFFQSKTRSFLPRARMMLSTLLEDKSDYIRAMACYPLSILLGNRFSFCDKTLCTPFLAQSRERALKVAKEIESEALQFIAQNLNVSKNLTKNLPKLFDRMRLVDFETAKELHQFAVLGGVSLLKEVIPVLLFFAHFRERFVSATDQDRSPLLSSVLVEEFDYQYFREVLEELTSHGDSDLKRSLSWHVMKMSDIEESKEAIENVSVSLHYFELLSKNYSKEVFQSIYMFVREHISSQYRECFELWLNCLRVERSAIDAALDAGGELYDIQWWPFYFNGEILVESFKQGEIEDFLKGVELLLDYPDGVVTGLDDKVVEVLKTLKEPHGRIESIFDRWITKNYDRLRDKEAWLEST